MVSASRVCCTGKSLNNNDRDQVYEPARLSIPPKPFFSLKPLDANLVEVIVIYLSSSAIQQFSVSSRNVPRHNTGGALWVACVMGAWK